MQKEQILLWKHDIIDTNERGVQMNFPHNNLDFVFKEALVLFKNKTLDFLGIDDIAPLGEALRTETIEVKWNFQDLVFATQDGRGLHLEEQANLTKSDLLRFAAYNINLNIVHKRDFDTVIFVRDPSTQTKLETKQFCFTPTIIRCTEIDADIVLDKLKRDLAAGKELNELSLIYLPLFRSASLSLTDLFVESARLICKVQVDDMVREKLKSLLIGLVGNKVENSRMEEVMMEMRLEDNAMLQYMWERVQEKAEKQVNERANELANELANERVEERVEKVAIKLLSKGMDILDVAETTGFSEERVREIALVQ